MITQIMFLWRKFTQDYNQIFFAESSGIVRAHTIEHKIQSNLNGLNIFETMFKIWVVHATEGLTWRQVRKHIVKI